MGLICPLEGPYLPSGCYVNSCWRGLLGEHVVDGGESFGMHPLHGWGGFPRRAGFLDRLCGRAGLGRWLRPRLADMSNFREFVT